MSAELRHSGEIAPGVSVVFTFNTETRAIAFEMHGQPRSKGRERMLQRYRAVRLAFFQRVTAVTGEAISVMEIDEHGRPDGVHTIQPPQGGNA